MIRALLAAGGGLALVLALVAVAWAQGPAPSIEGVHVSLGEVIAGFLLLLCGFLFTSSIRQGNQIAALQRGSAAKEDVVKVTVDTQHNADDIAVLQGEAATVDRRIQESRHALRGELGVSIAQLEDRMDARFTELRGTLEGIRRWLERNADSRGRPAPPPEGT